MRGLAGSLGFIVALGFQVSGYQNLPLAFTLWGIAGIMAVWELVTWTPIRRRLIRANRTDPMISLITAIVIGAAVGGIAFGLIWHFASVATPEAELRSPAPAPAPQPAPPTPSEKPIIVPDDVTPHYLSEIYAKHTEIQADVLAEKTYIGKWIKVSGPIYDIGEGYKSVNVSIGISRTNDTFISMTFDINWKDRLSHLRKNTPITVLGQIKRIQLHQLNLHHCELVETS